MNFSQTQLTNIFILAGIAVWVLNQFGIILEQNVVAYIIGAVFSVGGVAYSWYKRFKKGDLTLGGFRK